MKRPFQWYLVGPIDSVSDGSDRRWRTSAKQLLACIDPFDIEADYARHLCGPDADDDPEALKKRFRGLARDLLLFQLREEMDPILGMCAQAVTDADGLFVYVPRAYPSMWGSAREVTIAHIQQKPIVVWSDLDPIAYNNTMVCMSTVICPTFFAAVDACRAIQADDMSKLDLLGI